MDQRLHLPIREPMVLTALELLDGVGPATVAILADLYPTVGDMLADMRIHAGSGTVPKGIKRPVVASLRDPAELMSFLDRVERDFEETIDAGGIIVHPGGGDYPASGGQGSGPVLRIFGEPLDDSALCGIFGAASDSPFGSVATTRIASVLHEAGVVTATCGDGPIERACMSEAARRGSRHVSVLDRGWTPTFRSPGSIWTSVLEGGGTLVGRFGHGAPYNPTLSLEAGDTLVSLCRAMVAIKGSDGNAIRKAVSRTFSAKRPLMLVVPPESHSDRSDKAFIDYVVNHRNAGDLVRLLHGRNDYPGMIEAVLGTPPSDEHSPTFGS